MLTATVFDGFPLPQIIHHCRAFAPGKLVDGTEDHDAVLIHIAEPPHQGGRVPSTSFAISRLEISQLADVWGALEARTREAVSKLNT
jgi:hypothetical protein